MRLGITWPLAIALVVASGGARADTSRSAHVRAEAPRIVARGAREKRAARDPVAARTRKLMATLGVIAAGSVASGIALTTRRDPFAQWVGVQNVVWGTVDAAIAANSLRELSKRERDFAPRPLPAEEGQARARTFARWVAIDALIALAGGVLWAASDRDEVRGTGAGVLLQASAHIVFDGAGFAVMRAAH